MIERIDLFMPPRSRYEVLHHFTRNFAAALQRTGVNCRILEAQRERPQDFVDAILQDPPECTLSFNGLLPDENGKFFCDLIQIPHVGCLTDSPQNFLALTQSPLSVVTCVDRFYCEFFEGLNFQNVLFMPHGVDKGLISPRTHKEQRHLDVLMLASFLDFEIIEQEWKKNLDPVIFETLEDAAAMVLSDRSLSTVQAFAHALDKKVKSAVSLDPNAIDFLMLLEQLEDYINGKDRLALVRSIKDATVHVYGGPSSSWKKHLKDMKNVHVHDPVSYVQALELMKKSKIVLNSCQTIKYGAHERIFAGIACGAVVLTNENAYMHDNFKNRESILFYRHGHWDEVNQIVNEYLKDAQKSEGIVQVGQEIILDGHTWDHRAATLVSELSPILRKIKHA